MKNKILLYFLLIIASSSVSTMNAQLKVSENGNVGIHLNSSITPASMLAIIKKYSIFTKKSLLW